MELIIVGYIGVALLGLVFGSFAGATVWRLRARQLLQDKAAGEEYDSSELKRLKPLTKATLRNDRSRCLHCGHTLAWYDLLPLASWLSTGGRCRYCKKPIGRFEPMIELGMSIAFVAYYHYWVVNGASSLLVLGFWLVAIVMLGILFAYDQKWFLLPDSVMWPLIIIAFVYAAISIVMAANPVALGVSTAVGVAILSGLYLMLWLVSRGAWVGFGDVKLGLALGLLLQDWRFALLTLFLANLIGTLVVLPGLMTRRMNRRTQVPFGPLLIAGFAISLLYGQLILEGYNAFSMWLGSTMLML